MGEKERFEILLEEIRHDVKTIAEGHDALLQEMSRGFGTFRNEVTSIKLVHWCSSNDGGEKERKEL